MMKLKIIIVTLLVWLGSISAHAQVGSSVVTAQGAFTLNTGDVLTLRAEVVSCGQGQLPLYNGLPISLTPNQTFLAPFTANSSQVVTFTVPGNDKIMCGNQTYTMYAITWLDNGFPIAPTATYRFADATLYTLSQQVPISFIPPVLSNSAGALCPSTAPVFQGFSSTYQIQCSVQVPNQALALPITGGVLTGPLFFSQANNSYVAGSASYPTLQSAVNAAGASGSVVIPGSYGGTDSFTTNTNGVLIDDLRPRALGTTVSGVTIQTNPINTVKASDFGATCTGGHDDTAAIQSALNSAWAYNLPLTVRKNVTVELPQGSCLVFAPLELGIYTSLVGHDSGTFLVCDYAGWTSSDHNCLEAVANGPIAAGASIGQRRIGGFSLIGISNSAIPDSTGISFINNADITAPNYTFINISIDHMQIADFDTLIYAEDFSDSTISYVKGTGSRIGFNFNGNVTNIQVHHDNIFDGSLAHTSTTGTTYGVIVQPNNKYAIGGLICSSTVYCGGQDIALDHTNVLSYDTLVHQVQCIACSYTYGAFDQAAGGPAGSGYSFQLDGSAIGDGLWITHNQIGTQNSADPLIFSTSNNSALFVSNNLFFVDAGRGDNGTIGLVMAGSGTFSQLELVDNIFQNMTEGVSFQQNVQYSTITGNSGSGILDRLIDLSGTASLVHTGTVLRDNVDSDNVAVIGEGTATKFRAEWNQSPFGLIGSQTVLVAGCSFAAGTIGTKCATPVTITWPVAFHDSTYSIQCSVQSPAAGSTGIGVAGAINASSASVNEVALDTSSTGGGSLACTATHF